VTATALAAVAFLPGRAGAEPISLTVNNDTSIQQVLNTPCVIGDPSCRNPDTFPYTLLAPQMDAATVDSPVYTVEQIRNAVGSDTFDVGLDLNQAMGHNDGTYRLLAFTLAVNGTVVFSLPSPINVTPLNPGNGYSDALIQGFDLSGWPPTPRSCSPPRSPAPPPGANSTSSAPSRVGTRARHRCRSRRRCCSSRPAWSAPSHTAGAAARSASPTRLDRSERAPHDAAPMLHHATALTSVPSPGNPIFPT
jgi:hypothetical protein